MLHVFWYLAGPPLLGAPEKLFNEGPYPLPAALLIQYELGDQINKAWDGQGM